MLAAIKRTIVVAGGMLGCSVACLLCRPALEGPRGAAGPSILQADSPVAALVAVILCIGLAAIIALIVTKLANLAVGLFCLGWGIFVLTERLQTAEELAWTGGSLSLLGVETLLVGLLVLAVALLLFRLGGPFEDVEPPEPNREPGLLSTDSLISAAAGLLVVPAVWFIATTHTNAQTVGAVFVGGIAAAMSGRMLRPHVQPILVFASPIFFGAIGHMVAARGINATIEQAFVSDQLWPLSLPMPLSYAAGSLMGAAVGLGWVRSFLYHEEDEPETQRVPDTA